MVKMKNWFEYYWRCLFYSNIPAVKSSEDISKNNLFCVNEEGSLNVVEFANYQLPEKALEYWNENNTRGINVCIAPIEVCEMDGEIIKKYYFPFWFVLKVQPNYATAPIQWSLSMPDKFKRIYVPRTFLDTIENEDFIFSKCKTYEKYCNLKSGNLKDYISEIRSVFQSLTEQEIESYQPKNPKFTVRHAIWMLIERPYDYTQKMRWLYGMLQNDKTPNLLKDLIVGIKDESVLKLNADKLLKNSRLHINQIMGRPLSDSQKIALYTCLSGGKDDDIPEQKIMVINGPPGTGKTTLIRNLVATKVIESAIKGEEPFLAICCGPSHKAIINIINCLGINEEYYYLPIKHLATYYNPRDEYKCNYIYLENTKSGIDLFSEEPKVHSKKFLLPEDIKNAKNKLNKDLKTKEDIQEALKNIVKNKGNSVEAFNLAIKYWQARWLQAEKPQKTETNKEEDLINWRKETMKYYAMLTPCFVVTCHSCVNCHRKVDSIAIQN